MVSMHPTNTDPPPDAPTETTGVGDVTDITPTSADVQFITHSPTPSERRRMNAPPTRISVPGKPKNRAYRRAEASAARKNKKKGSSR